MTLGVMEFSSPAKVKVKGENISKSKYIIHHLTTEAELSIHTYYCILNSIENKEKGSSQEPKLCDWPLFRKGENIFKEHYYFSPLLL
jgi:hypothetical protein